MTRTGVETQYLYMYGVLLAEELQHSEVPSIMGIDEQFIIIKTVINLAAVMTPVDAKRFSQRQIDLQLKDAEWLKENALHHHHSIAMMNEKFTILPMPFCTIFQNEENLEKLLIQQHDALHKRLSMLQGVKEWNLKLFCEVEKALSYVVKHNLAVVELREGLASMPKGKQFLMKKRLEHLISSEFEFEQSKWVKEIMEQLAPVVAEVNIRQNWGKEVTERKEEMIANCDFLINQIQTERFLSIMEELERRFADFGCSFHVTGPWPPYHFSKMIQETK